MNITLKLVLFKGKTHADGTHPIQLQFTVHGKQKRKGIYKCLAKDWDDKVSRVRSKVTNSAYINNFLSEQYAEAERELIKVMNGQAPSSAFFDIKPVLTLDYIIDMELARFKKEKKAGAYARVMGYKNQMAEFANSSSLNVADINLKWFENLAAYLADRGNNGSTVQKKVKTIRRMIEKYTGVRPTEDVKSFRVPTKKPVKQKLTALELLAIENLVLDETKQISVVRDLFLLQIYLRGSRVGALLMAYSNQFKDGRYSASNGTGKNNVGSRLIPKAQEIVDKYYGKYERLFPIYTWSADPKLSEFENQRRMTKRKESATTIVNKHLKRIGILAGIDKPLSSHIARHTFARMAIDKINNPMITMELLGHSSLAIHQGYLNDIRKDEVLDQAADDIFG